MLLRRLVALLALGNALVAFYLHLWKTGKVGALVCAAGHGCEIAQFSQWGWFLGVDVALIGTVGYLLILGAALWGTANDAAAADPRPTLLLAALVTGGFLFTLRLKYAEFVILKTFCPWCAISAVSMTVLVGLVWADWRRVRAGRRLPESA